MYALGLIETVGYTTAVSAADAALKAADVELIAVERVIGAGGALGVTIQLSGDVAAVSSAVEAGRKEAERVGKLISAHVIPRAHAEVDQKLLSQFKLLPKGDDLVTATERKKAPSAKKRGGSGQVGRKTSNTQSKSEQSNVDPPAVDEKRTAKEAGDDLSPSDKVNEG